MTDCPDDIKYSRSHEWIKMTEEGDVVIGITEHAQSLLGDLVYVELPEINTEVKAGDEVGVVESVKSASDLYTPLTGEIIAINEDLEENAAIANTDPYGAGWIFKLKPTAPSELDDLMEVEDYKALVEEEH